ncbi:NAD(P)/FAD-dependent oxidoreductase [Aquibacillus albus]|uniref:Ferredoxin--NADP reductase n=1 Tax=Aquibacillus albus TaxID=1168171 RepID=A0ABS2N4E2_9BACI|nr:NAD(P)/FAD-dependent oxidoreductase [Aquibacillus albus]MBM7572760.1 thioredoxin reductase (NADPH) [Aquibacillus albus]
MNENEIFDVTIIGGGPAGLYSSFYSGLREMKTKVIEFQPQLGGKIHVYPEKMIWDVGGLPPITGAQLIEQLVNQGLTFDPEVVLNERVTSISKNENGVFVLKAASGSEHLSKTIIIATGSGILKPHKLEIEGAEKYEISNLHYTVKSLHYFKDKTVIISGGGDSAIDWANEVEPIAKKVYLAHRKDTLTGHESNITKLLNSSVDCMLQTKITKLLSSVDRVSIKTVELTNQETNKVFYVDIDDVIVNHGFDRDASLLENTPLKINLVDNYFIDGSTMSESSIQGLFAAGDILTHEGKLNLIAGAFQDAANAVNKAKQFIEPDATAVGMVSSHNEIFKKRNRELIRQWIK